MLLEFKTESLPIDSHVVIINVIRVIFKCIFKPHSLNTVRAMAACLDHHLIGGIDSPEL